MNRPRYEDGLFGSSFHNTSGIAGISTGTLHGNSYYNPNVSQSFTTSNHHQHQYGHGLGNQTGSEPMHMSPVSGSLSPQGAVVGGADRVQYLPSYLLGEPSKSPKGKLRKDLMTPSLDLSNVSAVQQNSFAGPSGQFSPSFALQSPMTPPVSNVFSSTKGPVSTSTPTAALQKAGPPKHGLGTAASGLTTTPTKSAPTEESGRGYWITVFGFQPANQSYVLQTFATIGSIVEYKANPGCNWIHIRYSSSIEARKALSKNGSILGGTMMIGVMKFDGQAGSAGGSGAPTSVSMTTPTAAGDHQTENIFKSRIRPLASDNLINQIPVRESGIISKVTELFGW